MKEMEEYLKYLEQPHEHVEFVWVISYKQYDALCDAIERDIKSGKWL